MTARIAMTKAREGELCEAYKRGKSLEQVGRQFGLTAMVVRKRLIENNVPLRASGLPAAAGYLISLLDESGKAELAELRRQGKRWAYIAKHFEAKGVEFSHVAWVKPRGWHREIDLEKAAKLYVQDRWSLRRVADELNANDKTVRGALARAGVRIRGHREMKALMNDALVFQLRVLRLRGWSWTRLTKLAGGVTKGAVMYAVTGITWKHVPFPGAGDVANDNAIAVMSA